MGQTGFAGAAEAAAELEWLFTEADGRLGQHAQTYDPDRIIVFDPEAAHMAHLDPTHRADQSKEARVSRLYAMLSHEHKLVVAVAFSPRQWSPGLRLAFRRGNACLAGLAAHTMAVWRAMEAANQSGLNAWRKKCDKVKPDEPPPSKPKGCHSPIDFLESRVGEKGLGSRDMVRAVMGEASARLAAACRAYDDLRTQDAREKAEEQRKAG